ncbi:MAG TPA: helix-turn-helix domain-containing protein [Stellaceae bacterium]|nr:helix-turn-helix domain-containing protein [Stellaceae bacterium]
MKSRKQANVEETRKALLTAARRHFARRGYSDAEIGRIARDARVTTGAVYHHFSSKKGLFQAVAEELEAEILAAAANPPGDDVWARLRNGYEALIDVCAAPAVQRIIFVEAPQVIGPAEWREIELRYAFGVLRSVLTGLVAQQVLRRYPVDLLAQILLALLRETSAEVAKAPKDRKRRAEVSDLVSRLFNALTTG